MGYAGEASDLKKGPEGKYVWQGCPFVGDEPAWTSDPALVAHEARCGREFFRGTARQRRRCYRPSGHRGGHFLGDSRWVHEEGDAHVDARRGS